MIITLATSQNCPPKKKTQNKKNRSFFDLKKHDLAQKEKKGGKTNNDHLLTWKTMISPP
jgi:hypothetical protein